MERKRCFGDDDLLMARYHDEEWGLPVHDDRDLFERLLLEGFQAGLSWRTILHKRENFIRAFEGFDPVRVADYSQKEVTRLMADAGIVRNRRKIEAAITNAQAFLRIQQESGSFSEFFWAFSGHQVLEQPAPETFKDVPAQTELSQLISGELKKRGFKFVGPTILYAFMQSVGMVNDHLAWCFIRNSDNRA